VVIEFDEAVPTEDVTMRQLLARRALRSGISLVGLAVLVVGCASHSLVPKEQAGAIRDRDRALTPHAAAIEDVIRRSGTLGALAFLDAGDGHLVVLPGDTPTDAWARHTASGSGTAGSPVSVPTVVDFVYRPDVPKAPETVTQAFLQQQETLRARMAALDAELRKLSDSLVATRQETQASIATAREDTQKALDALAGDLAAARKFMLQTAQLGWLDHDLTAENASGLRKLATTSQELTATSAKLTETIQHLSDTLARQLKELSARLDAIQNRISNVK
jgi:hypothetical protein